MIPLKDIEKLIENLDNQQKLVLINELDYGLKFDYMVEERFIKNLYPQIKNMDIDELKTIRRELKINKIIQ